MVLGLSHITLVVKDLERTAIFLKEIFGAREIYSSGDNYTISRAKYFMINDLWFCLNEGESLTQRTYNHIAFKIEDNEFDEFIIRIKNVGAEIKQGRPRVGGEGRSIYFYDYDNNLFELHTGNLDERLVHYRK